MSPNELMTLVGLAWPRLIIYPGGLALLALIWFVAGAKNQELRTASGSLVLGSRFLGMSSLVLAWLGLALLPLPAAVPIGRKTDVVIVLALLEWPRVVVIAGELHAEDASLRMVGVRRLAAALNSYPTLLLATLALAQPAGSLDIGALARSPGEATSIMFQAVHWLGAGAWLLALAPLIGLGPFRAMPLRHQNAKVQTSVAGFLAAWRFGDRTPRCGLAIALLVRGFGLGALAALPWLAPFGALAEQGSYSSTALLAIVAVPVALGGLIWFYDRATAHHSARRWAKAYFALDAVLLLALLLAAYAALERK